MRETKLSATKHW